MSGKIEGYFKNRDYLALVFIIIASFALRLYLSLTTTFTWDEERDVILTADKISTNYLPIRGIYHSALSEYLVKISSLIFGTSHTGYRMFSIIFGTLTIVVIYFCAKAAWGKSAAILAAILLAFNEYHINVSSLAIQKVFYLSFVSLGIFAFILFLKKKDGRFLYLTTASAGLGFLCYELAALLLPACYLILLTTENREWLKRKEPYLAALLFFLIVSPDIVGSLLKSSSGANYAEHFSRFGFGLTEQPLTFYLFWGLWHSFGIESMVNDPYINRMNFIFGAMMFACVLWASIRAKDSVIRFLLLLFWSVMLFLLVSKGASGRGDLSVAVWHWADLTLPAAVLIAAYVISQIQGKWKYAVFFLLVLGGISAVRSVISRFDDKRPDYAVRYSPEFTVPSEKMITVRAFFDYCDLCDKNPKIELMEIEHISGDMEKPAFVQEAEFGTDDREYRLPAISGRYKIIYKLTDNGGNTRILDDMPYGGVGLLVRERNWQPVFWVRQ